MYPLYILLTVIKLVAFVSGDNYVIDAAVYSFEKKYDDILARFPSNCSRDLRRTVADAKNMKSWALKVFDSLPKYPAGALDGNLMQFGSSDECLQNAYPPGMDGQYCVTYVSASEKYGAVVTDTFRKLYFSSGFKASQLTGEALVKMQTIMWGICVPRSCNASELQTIANELEDSYKSILHFRFIDIYCSNADPPDLAPRTIGAIVFFSVIIGLMVASTIYDVYVYQHKADKKEDLFIAFSVYSNGKKLFSTKTSDKKMFTVMYGMRTMSIIWIVFGHTHMMNIYYPTYNNLYILKWTRELRSILAMSGPLSVETFLVLSGFLVFYIYINVRKNLRMEIPLYAFYMHRLLRLTPALGATILIYLGFVRYVGDGPYWRSKGRIYEANCAGYWWSTLLYCNNIFSTQHLCLSATWYLAVDTQLYLISPLLLFVYLRKPMVGVAISVCWIFASICYCFYLAFAWKLPTVIFHYDGVYYDYIYYNTLTRSATWKIGGILGYYFTTAHFTNTTYPRTFYMCGWIICLLLQFIVFYGHYLINFYPYDALTAAFFTSLHRPIWALCLCWMIYACTKKRGGFIDTFLSLKVFEVLSRINYTMFLTHTLVIYYFLSSRRLTLNFTNTDMFFYFGANVLLALVLAIPWTLAFESPVYILEKYILGTRVKKSRKEPDGDDETATPTATVANATT